MSTKQIDALKLALESAAGLALEVMKKHRQMKGEYPMGMLGARAVEEIEAVFREMDDALAEQAAQGCDYCNHPQYAGTKCKSCGREQPAQPWVGLTDDEFEDIELGCRSTPFGKIEAMRKVEAKLREKNA